jgi:hypothetical protein
VVSALGTKPHGGHARDAEPSALSGARRHAKALLTPEALDPLAVDLLPRAIDLEHLDGDHALEADVLALELLQALRVIGLHAAVLGPPAVEGLLGDLQGLGDLRGIG